MKDIAIYNERMCKSLLDKVWFMNELSHEDLLVIDYGCGNGDMMRFLNENFGVPCIGYDTSREMINIGLNKWDHNAYYDDWNAVIKQMSYYPRHKKVIVFSSVFHEVPNKYKLLDSIDFNYFDYIAIRDMYYTGKFTEKLRLDKICRKLPPMLGEKIVNERSAVQAIMKSYYPENIDTEILEDYFSFKFEHINWFKERFKCSKWKHYTLPYWKEKFKNDWKIDLYGIKTHVQLLFKNDKIHKQPLYNIEEND